MVVSSVHGHLCLAASFDITFKGKSQSFTGSKAQTANLPLQQNRMSFHEYLHILS